MPRSYLSLCFSGGGFRATLFHLGMTRALYDLEMLHKITHIFSVSGGSITAAHLVLNWERYTSSKDDDFRSVATELIKFVRMDLRGRIVRRWILLGWMPPFYRTRQIIRYYDKLFRNSVLETLIAAGRPQLFILTTSMLSGDLCCFHSKGLIRNFLTDPKDVTAPELRVALAVAASSAFPPFFPPVTFGAREIGAMGGEMIAGEKLTDGGVFDNLGVRAALSLTDSGPVILSEASSGFEQSADESFWNIVSRTKRTSEILMNRVAKFEEAKMRQSGRSLHLSAISSIVEQNMMPKFILDYGTLKVQPMSIQKWVKNVRTDVDAFSDIEIRSIYHHGYETGMCTAKDLLPKEKLLTQPNFWWDPCSTSTERDDLRKRTKESFEKIKNFNWWKAFKESDATVPDMAAVEALKKSRKNMIRLWNSQDLFCWCVALAAATAIVTTIGLKFQSLSRLINIVLRWVPWLSVN